MPAVVSSDRWTTTFIHGEKILTGFSIPRRFIWRSLELRESVNWVLDSFEREKMLTGFLIPRSFIEREKIWTRLSIPRSSIERSLGCILSETARKPNYRFSVRPKPKSWLSVEKGSWYDDHDKSIHCFLRTLVMICIDGQPLLCFCPVILAIAIGSEFCFLIWCYICISVLCLYPYLSFESIFHLYWFSPPLTLRWWHIAYQIQNKGGIINIAITSVIVIPVSSSSSRCIEIGQPRAYLALPGASASRLFTNCDSFCTLVN